MPRKEFQIYASIGSENNAVSYSTISYHDYESYYQSWSDAATNGYDFTNNPIYIPVDQNNEIGVKVYLEDDITGATIPAGGIVSISAYKETSSLFSLLVSYPTTSYSSAVLRYAPCPYANKVKVYAKGFSGYKDCYSTGIWAYRVEYDGANKLYSVWAKLESL